MKSNLSWKIGYDACVFGKIRLAWIIFGEFHPIWIKLYTWFKYIHISLFESDNIRIGRKKLEIGKPSWYLSVIHNIYQLPWGYRRYVLLISQRHIIPIYRGRIHSTISHLTLTGPNIHVFWCFDIVLHGSHGVNYILGRRRFGNPLILWGG